MGVCVGFLELIRRILGKLLNEFGRFRAMILAWIDRGRVVRICDIEFWDFD
jgi:hypothetical protein